MYQYHGSDEHAKRLASGRCRCASNGPVYDVVALLRDGLLLDPRDMQSLLSTPEVRPDPNAAYPPGSGYGRTFIFAISEDLDVHVAPDSDRGLQNAVKHETLFHNAHVLAAGEIFIKNGIISGINDISGSYDTIGELLITPDFARNVLNAFLIKNLPFTPSLRDRLVFLAN